MQNHPGVLHEAVLYTIADTGMGAALYPTIDGDERCANIGGDERCANIGGDERCANIEAAANAGLSSVHVDCLDPERRERCVLGDYRVESFEELWSDHVSADD